MHRFRHLLASTLLLATAALVPPAAASAAPATTTVSVDVRAGLATVPGTAIGVNHAIWDTTLGTPAVSDLLKDAGVRMVRYPGGSYADIYHWKDHTAPGGYVAPDTDFDTFMAGARRTGAQPMIIANYGTGSPEEAAEWVAYANVEKDYDVTYWTVGNENYGNGHYGSAWEADERDDKSPAGYADLVVAYSEAMKAVDPDIKVGAVLTMPGNWPDGIVAGGDAGTWNKVVLERAGDAIDFVDVHWYPGGSTAAEGLSRTAHIEDAMVMLREQISAYAHPGVEISMTETNVDHGRNTQPGALFLADAYSGLLAQGVFTVHWWNVHNGLGTVTTQAGQTDYGDFGLLSSGNCNADQTVCQPPLNTPFAPYHALDLMADFARPGDQFVRAGTADPLLGVHAVRRGNGDLAVLLLNKDPDTGRTVELDFPGWASSGVVAASRYVNGATGISAVADGTTLPPYSLTLVTLRPNRAEPTRPAAPARPQAGAITDRTATITWPAGAPGLKYEVFRQNGGRAEQLGETTGTAFTARNLVPGKRYTVNVVARAANGTQSWASPPLTFTTGGPASSTCAVTFADTTNWGNGYVGSIDVKNTGSEPVTNWTLTFGWPTTWQSVTSGWNATWTQSGTTVRVTNEGTIPAGGTTNVGFVASYSGPNVPPAAFTLNGRVCSVV